MSRRKKAEKKTGLTLANVKKVLKLFEDDVSGYRGAKQYYFNSKLSDEDRKIIKLLKK